MLVVSYRYYLKRHYSANCGIIPMDENRPLAFTDYWAPMSGLVGQLAALRPQVAILRRFPMDWAFVMIGLVGQLAARWLQVALLARSPMHWPSNGHEMTIKGKVKVTATYIDNCSPPPHVTRVRPIYKIVSRRQRRPSPLQRRDKERL